MLDSISKLVQVLSVVVGVVVSIWSFTNAQKSEAEARAKEAEARKLELAKPFLELRQKFYLEAVHAAAVLANPEVQTDEDLDKARKRFRELYVAELSMVECPTVEASMVKLAQTIDKDLTRLTPAQSAALDLAHALRDTFVVAWEVEGTCAPSP
ncbi:MAG TPA: hypothetical protein VHA10_18895 [Hypericibacter adhaerens]|jgi:hypothetical protein|uniref:hypothetical protein n=1 Tax=Hypericibacter adhaerens TaxID=2602016 RepID=UPI002B7FCE5B|nr:hypothetical protein [Hypericibacter adhaerens]HWA45296.1 hypothetical protein [Hypericibacter adhaerens]